MTGSRKGWIKFGAQFLLGMAASYGATTLLHKGRLLEVVGDSPGAVALFLVGAAYLMTGLLIYLGGLMPRLGARILLVQDADETGDLRPVLLASGIALVALGAGQVVLVLADAAVVSPVIGASAMLSAIALATLVSVYQWSLYDEFWKQVTLEGSAIALWILLFLVIAWAVFAQFGWGPAVDPLGLIALLLGAGMVGMLIAGLGRGFGTFD